MAVNRNPNEYFATLTESIAISGQMAEYEDHRDVCSLEEMVIETETRARNHINMVEELLAEARDSQNEPLNQFIMYYRRMFSDPYRIIRGIADDIRDDKEVYQPRFINPWATICVYINAFQKVMEEVFEIDLTREVSPHI